jgi:TRAP-type C4-dicarboxylate transport system permease small subunit
MVTNPPSRTALGRVCSVLDHVSRIILGALIGLIVLVTCMAVWWRYVLNDPLSWTEQISRILFVWVTFLGAASLYRGVQHIAIDMLYLALPVGPLRQGVYWLNQVLILLLAVLLFWFGGKLSLDNLSQTFGALEISPSTFYLAAPVSAVLIIVYWFEKLLDPATREPLSTERHL